MLCKSNKTRQKNLKLKPGQYKKTQRVCAALKQCRHQIRSKNSKKDCLIGSIIFIEKIQKKEKSKKYFGLLKKVLKLYLQAFTNVSEIESNPDPKVTRRIFPSNAADPTFTSW